MNKLLKNKNNIHIFTLLFLFLLIAPIIAQQPSIEQKIALTIEEVKTIKHGDSITLDLSFLEEKLKDKKIVILGERGHGDGKTFEIKTEIIKYLVKNEGFTTIALEGCNFLSGFILSQKMGRDSLSNALFKKDITWAWLPPWSYAKQTQGITTMIKKGQINCLGIDNQPTGGYEFSLVRYLKKYTDSLKIHTLNDSEWISLKNLHRSFLYKGLATRQNKDSIDLYRGYLQRILKGIQIHRYTVNSWGDILTQSLKNMFAYIDQSKYDVEFSKLPASASDSTMPYSEIELTNIRDKQMYDNIAWYMQRNPQAKIIVWAAAFHGCRDVSSLSYRREKDTSYKSVEVMGGYLSKDFGDKLYSMAFTSSLGTQSYAYDTNTYRIDTVPNTMEYYLLKKDYEYGYLDFDSLKKTNEYANKKFNTLLFAYPNEYWLNAFDGVFYLRNEERAIFFKPQ